MSVLEDVEHRAEQAPVWVAEAAGKVVAAVTLTFYGQPYSEIALDGELEFRMLAVDPTTGAPGPRRGPRGGARGSGTRPAAARDRSDQHHQRHVHGARPRFVRVVGVPRRTRAGLLLNADSTDIPCPTANL